MKFRVAVLWDRLRKAYQNGTGSPVRAKVRSDSAPFSTTYLSTIEAAFPGFENYLMKVPLPAVCRRAIGLCSLTIAVVAFGGVRASAQARFAGKANQGMNAYSTFEGSGSSSGAIFDMNNMVGYDFNAALGFDVGVPFYFVAPPAQPGVASTAAGVGNFYLDGRMTLESHVVDYLPTATVTFPTGNTSKGLSTGSVTYDLDSRFQHDFGVWTPFFDVDVGNSLDNTNNPDVRVIRRPFLTLGKVAQFKAGPEVHITERIILSADYYRVVPWGPQTVISRVVKPGKTGKGGKSGRVYEVVQKTVGGANLVSDNGFDASVAFSPKRFMDLSLAFNHSTHYALNSVSFSLGFNLTQMLSRNR
jgi:hypothetical protein